VAPKVTGPPLRLRSTSNFFEFGDLNGTLRTFMWVVSGWLTFLTAVLAVFGFLRG
jgi:hypothetical protein